MIYKKANWYKIAQNNSSDIIIYDFDDTIACGTTNMQRILNIGNNKPHIWLSSFLEDYRRYGDNLYIMTARMYKTVGDCRKLIKNFLKQFGIDFPESNIICTGFLPSTWSRKKIEIEKILENEAPENLIFVDNDINNRAAIDELQNDYPETNILVTGDKSKLRRQK
jgi:hypothetical protein